MNSMVEAMLRAQIVQEITSAMPNEVVTEWEAGYYKGLKKAVQIVKDME